MLNRILLSCLLLLSSCAHSIPQAWSSTLASRQYNWVDDKNNGIPITASRQDAELDNIITKLNQKVLIASSAPSSPIAGELWYDSTNKLLKQYRNSEWVINGVVHVGTSSPSTNQTGDLWYDSTNKILKTYNGTSYDTASASSIFTQNVGIGTALPAGGLDVEGTLRDTIFYARVNGNVGIGSLTPGQRLDVQGTVRASYFTGNGTAITGIPTSNGTSYSTGVVYQNTGTTIMMVQVHTFGVCNHDCGWSGMFIRALIGATNTPATEVGRQKFEIGNSAFPSNATMSFGPLTFLVPVNYYWEVVSGTFDAQDVAATPDRIETWQF